MRCHWVLLSSYRRAIHRSPDRIWKLMNHASI
jgi:hypothetical protein